jgi:hypothetical protein
MLNLGVTLGQAGKPEEETATYRDLITRLGESTCPELQEQVAKAMVILGITLGQAGNAEEALSTYRDLITRLGESTQGSGGRLAWSNEDAGAHETSKFLG